jgi:hypothetical protein
LRVARTAQAESHNEGAVSWTGTASDLLLEAAQQSSFLYGVILSSEVLKDLMIAAQNWIVQQSQGGSPDYAKLARRIIEEGVLSVLVHVTVKRGNVPDPSIYLHPSGIGIEFHFQVANAVLNESTHLFPESEDHYSPTSVSQTEQLSKTHIFTLSEVLEGVENDPMATPTINKFLAGLARVANSGNAEELRNWLPIEPPFAPTYTKVIDELRLHFAPPTSTPNAFQASTNSQVDALILKTDSALSSVRLSTGDEWSGFSNFVAQYLRFIRDVNPVNLLDTYDKLTDLMARTNTALNAPDVGVIMLPTTVAYAKVFARLAIGLEKQPELIAHLVEAPTDEGGESMSLPERAGNTIRTGFISCLNEKYDYPPNQPSRPMGRHAGIYKLANICLKIFFQCNKTKSAEQIFMNIGSKPPSINIFPRSERVTYLYYLGRFYFSMNHFYRAQAALQAAWDECHIQAQSQRRLILIYLVTSNIILGRLPSDALYQKPEAQGFRERFQPICNAIRRGDLSTFRRLTDMDNEHTDWFLFHRIFLQIRSRCEVLVWRSLSRRVWVLTGDRGNRENGRPPFLELELFANAARYLEQRALNPLSLRDGGPGKRHTNWVFMSQDPPKEAKYIDPDFEGLEEDEEYYDQDAMDEENPFLLPGLVEIESIVTSLVSQGLMSGYVSTQKKLVIIGAKRKDPVEAGWPNVWQTINARCEANGGDIPGWQRGGGKVGGMVVKLSGAKPVGM